MIELVAQLKLNLGLKIAIVSNEARELNAYRIERFKLDRLADCFISSCFVHIRKPDADIFRACSRLSLRYGLSRQSSSTILQCSCRSQREWEFKASSIQTSNPLAASSSSSDWMPNEPCDVRLAYDAPTQSISSQF